MLSRRFINNTLPGLCLWFELLCNDSSVWQLLIVLYFDQYLLIRLPFRSDTWLVMIWVMIIFSMSLSSMNHRYLNTQEVSDGGYPPCELFLNCDRYILRGELFMLKHWSLICFRKYHFLKTKHGAQCVLSPLNAYKT